MDDEMERGRGRGRGLRENGLDRRGIFDAAGRAFRSELMQWRVTAHTVCSKEIHTRTENLDYIFGTETMLI